MVQVRFDKKNMFKHKTSQRGKSTSQKEMTKEGSGVGSKQTVIPQSHEKNKNAGIWEWLG